MTRKTIVDPHPNDTINSLRAEVARLRAALADVLSYVSHGDMPVTIYDNARAALTRIALEDAAKVAIDVFDGKDEICSAEIAAAIRAMIKENT